MQADGAAKQAGTATTFLHVWWLRCGLKGCPPLLFIVDNRGPEATGWPHVLVEGALQALRLGAQDVLILNEPELTWGTPSSPCLQHSHPQHHGTCGSKPRSSCHNVTHFNITRTAASQKELPSWCYTLATQYWTTLDTNIQGSTRQVVLCVLVHYSPAQSVSVM
jgi:hypothetical protein